MTDARRLRILAIVLFAAIAVAAIAPIRNYDFFWHLSTGRWIAEHHALPLHDPFAVASDRQEWINGEWLFQLVVFTAHSIGGLAAMSFARALFAALLFTLVFLFARRETEAHNALLLTAIAFAGAAATFDLRPSSAAMLFVVLALVARGAIAQSVISAFWINVHPSALLAPVIAALSTRRALPVIASAVALFLNPFGYRALLAPIELMSFVNSGEFVNAEWLPSRITQFPLLYLCAAGGAVAFIRRRSEWWRVALFALFAYLAVRHVRNQGLFFAAFPLLVAPAVQVPRRIAYAASAAAVALIALTADHRVGVAPERFPLQAVKRLEASGLRGNIYNPDQFGGFVIWSFYGERRALTDGRNELYRTFIPEYAEARGDQRAWRALLRKYRIDLAVDEYRTPLQVVNAASGATTSMPASLAYWPRSEWALIAYDEAGMVFARRAAYPGDVIAKWEMRGVVPDAR